MLQEFHRRTGIAPALLDRKQKLSREVVEGTLRNEIVGQPAALRALTDRVRVSAARMNDLTRPMGVFLFLGSTGVGKTETAKAIAKFLFGEDGLVRIDMNELSGPTAVATLVGTFDSPSGRLTTAIRQRPHCVLLLDEIEKAHPAVLDVLLQVLGEARLTDARGRTVDFSGAMIIMTSNLGAEDTARRVGFGGGEDADQRTRLRAVRNYFRPEFFNRIDSIVHFGRLDRESVQQIAHLQLARALNRDGLTRRQTIMDIDPQVISWAVDSGFDSALGARAIKRSLERHLIDQVAARLTEIDPSLPTLVMLKPGKLANAFAKSPTAPLEISVISLPQVTANSPTPTRQSPQHILTTAQDLFAQ